MTTQPEALRLADELKTKGDALGCSFDRHSAELRRLHAENEALRVARDTMGNLWAQAKERLQALESDPAYDYCHRLAIMLECMALNADKNFDAACALLDEYNAARDKWAEAQGQPHVSGFGKD